MSLAWKLRANFSAMAVPIFAECGEYIHTFRCLDEAAVRMGPAAEVGSQQGKAAEVRRRPLLHGIMRTARAVRVFRASERLRVEAVGETSSERLRNNSSQHPQAATAEVPVAQR